LRVYKEGSGCDAVLVNIVRCDDVYKSEGSDDVIKSESSDDVIKRGGDDVIKRGDGVRLVDSVEKSKDVDSTKQRLVIIECGSGISLHSIRIESEALLRNDDEDDKGEKVKLIRLNPNHHQCPDGHIGIGMSAKLALQELAARLNLIKINTDEVENSMKNQNGNTSSASSTSSKRNGRKKVENSDKKQKIVEESERNENKGVGKRKRRS